MADVPERLSGVWIERLSLVDTDRPLGPAGRSVLLDPPYYGTEHYYGRGSFDGSEFAAMAARLAVLKGRFIVTVNDVPEIREAFADFSIEVAE